MKDETKEIERILATSGKYITYAERCYVLDYITNLQEENERLKQNDKVNTKWHLKLTEEYLPIAKARIEYAMGVELNKEKIKEKAKEEGQTTIFDFIGE